MVNVLNLAPTLELPPLVTSGFSFTSVQTAGAHWLVNAVQPFGILCAVFGTQRLKLMLWANSTVQLCWHMIWVKRSSSTIQPILAVSQWLKGQEVVHEQKPFMNTHVYVQPVKVRGSKDSSWTEVVYALSHTFSTKYGAESKYFRNSV